MFDAWTLFVSVVDVVVGVVVDVAVSVDVVAVSEVVRLGVVVVLVSAVVGAQALKIPRATMPVVAKNMNCSNLKCDVIGRPIVLYAIENVGWNNGFRNMGHDRVSLLSRGNVPRSKSRRSR
jgi:hypothetical protein